MAAPGGPVKPLALVAGLLALAWQIEESPVMRMSEIVLKRAAPPLGQVSLKPPPSTSAQDATGTGGTLNPGTGFTGASTPNSTGGFTYLRNRWYDPQTGRFLTQDPIGLAGGVNLYAYAGNNPVAYSDPFGLRADTVEVLGQRLKALVEKLRESDSRFRELYDRLDASTNKYVFISSELEPESGWNDPFFTGYVTTNDPSAFPSPVLTDEFQKYWTPGLAAGAMIGINHPKVSETVGHETVHLIGMEEIGRLYTHKDETLLWEEFPIP